MDWDQIESKWATMTRRVRGDTTTTKADATGAMPQSVAMTDAEASIGPDLQANMSSDSETPMLVQ